LGKVFTAVCNYGGRRDTERERERERERESVRELGNSST
jgi:hypothetical protein